MGVRRGWGCQGSVSRVSLERGRGDGVEGGIAPDVVGEGRGRIRVGGAYKPSVPPIDDAKTTPSTTQQMMIMIFFLRALL